MLIVVTDLIFQSCPVPYTPEEFSGTVDGYPFRDPGLEFIGNRSEPSQSAYAAATDPVPCKAATSIFFTAGSNKDFLMKWSGNAHTK